MSRHQCAPETCGGCYYDPCVSPWGELGALLAEIERMADRSPNGVPASALRSLVEWYGGVGGRPIIGRVTLRDEMGYAIRYEWINPADLVVRLDAEQ